MGERTLSFRLRGVDLLPVIHAEARRLGCDSRQLCVALLVSTFRGKLVDGVLDGDDPRAFARHYDMDRPPSDRTINQETMFTWLSPRIKATASGMFAASYLDVAIALDWHSSLVHRVARQLERRGDILMTQGSVRNKTRWYLPAEVA
jgi:hypothetical protein